MTTSAPVSEAPTSVALERHVFRAMGTEVELLVEARVGVDASPAMHLVETEFHRLEAIFSRFLPQSELSVLNRWGALYAGPELLDVVELALDARSRTAGRFDPTVHDSVVAAGYDRSFELVEFEGEAQDNEVAPSCAGRVLVDRARSLIELEPGFRLDLGGIAKGYAVDRTCDVLSSVGSCLVNAGGDLAVRGELREGPWPIGVIAPDGPVSLALRRGAMATSGRDWRRWRRGGEERHHLIDPTTGRPSESDILYLTVVASTAVEAEIQAKSLFLLGAQGAVRTADDLALPCLIVTADGHSLRAGGLR